MDKRKNDQFRDVTRGKEKKRKKSQCTNEKKDTEETSGSTAYVHVRSRRGQATNSHSLAERARREKISKKMKQLQALVPGCDKISHTALVLDAIINYMKSLQSQVESLSRKLAFVNSMSYGFGGDLDDFMKLDTLAFCPIQPTVLPEDGTTFITTNNYPILDSCTVCESQLQQGLSPFFFSQVYERYPESNKLIKISS
ncbi:hypothetical protein NE237_021650 [Protea cynaroides]|uniref:BHLH domain-containing protein n=1 Tax=Protea cynaroides TaxID=273540 RepID=A0A9Q0H9H8_9MAGN|nr:hypothetical protein NE237_021650 [Protea cynaroides]